MKCSLLLFSASITVAHGARYGLLRVHSSAEAPFAKKTLNERALFDDAEIQTAYRELIFDYERKLDGSLSLSLPAEPSYRDSDPPSAAPTDNVPVVPAPTSPPVVPPAATSFPTASTTIATPTPTTVEPIIAQEDQTASQNGESSEAVLEAKTAGEGDGEGVDALFTATVVLGCAAVAAVAAVIFRRRARASGNSSQGTGSDYSSMQSTTVNP